MRKSKKHIIIDPKSERADDIKFAARIPAEILQPGVTLRLPICCGEKDDGSKTVAPCKIVSVNLKKQLLRAVYVCGNKEMSETYKFVFEEEYECR